MPQVRRDWSSGGQKKPRITLAPWTRGGWQNIYTEVLPRPAKKNTQINPAMAARRSAHRPDQPQKVKRKPA